MTRIIGGSAGGRRINTPRGVSTRPTCDRVREALFSAVEAWCGSLAGLRFLDLYAGSGAVGLEARSRGAGVVTLVEHDRRTAALIAENAGPSASPNGSRSSRPGRPTLARSPGRAVRRGVPRPAVPHAGTRTSTQDLARAGRERLAGAGRARGRRARQPAAPNPAWPDGLVPDREKRVRRDRALVRSRRPIRRRAQPTRSED